MMRRMLVASLTVALLGPTFALGQTSPVRTVFSSDSMSVAMPTISPDGRWLVFVRVISNQETQLLIRPFAGGAVRPLFTDKGNHAVPRFTPKGDRLVFLSTLPRRTTSDIHQYLVSASFDGASGTLTSAPRQLSLDGVQPIPRMQYSISPDGRRIAYIECCTSGTLKVLPIDGGNARTLVTAEFSPAFSPALLAWTPDSRFVTYHTRTGDVSERKRVSVDGGAPSVVARVEGGMGPVTPDQRYYLTYERRPRPIIHFFDMQGREVGAVSAALRGITFSPDGRSLLGANDSTTATMRIVPVAGGPSRAVGRGTSYEWAEGWSPDAQELHISEIENGEAYVRIVGLDGTTKSRVKIPYGSQVEGIRDGQLFLREGAEGIADKWKLVSQSLADGSRKVLADDIVGMFGNPVAAGGMYYGITGKEIYYRKLRGDRIQIRAMSLGGTARLVAELPVKATGLGVFAVAGDRVAYNETIGDSVRLRVIPGASRPAITLLSVPRPQSVGEYAWSHDGRMLSLATSGQPQRMMIFHFDAAGNVAGAPQTFTLPVEYVYETFWLPDGSGLTMIAQPRELPTAEVILVRLSDPERPVILTKNDAGSKWGHALSPDGKYIAYPPELSHGSSIKMIDLTDVLRSAAAHR